MAKNKSAVAALPEKQRRIYEAIVDDPGISYEGLRKALGGKVSNGAVTSAIHALARKGFIEPVKASVWTVLK